MSVRVYIVEDHQLFRETIVEYIELTSELEICGVAGSAEAAVEELPGCGASVVLLDLSLPGRTGLSLLEEIQTDLGIPCIILSGHGERSHVERAFSGGARGYILKGRPYEVPLAVERVLAGRTYVSEGLSLPPGYPPDPDTGTKATTRVPSPGRE